ncbi:MAG: riboflavin synthase [Ignavibacteria bacterium]|nr:riboflavin synthase [Ignavibacteria bacterium]
MFTGIIESVGIIRSCKKINEGLRFRIECKKLIRKISISDSISVNGVCQTVISKDNTGFEFISVHETLKKTTLGSLEIGDEVNLETSLRAGDKIGGHFVYGHVDCTGKINSIVESKRKKSQKSDNLVLWIKVPSKFYTLVVPTGSIAVNGVSLTVADINPPEKKNFMIKISVIPFTLKHTNLQKSALGDSVNIEFDIIGKYLAKILSPEKNYNH